MRITTIAAGLAALLTSQAAGAADRSSLVAEVTTEFERVAGVPIVTLDRVDDDPSEVWYRAMQKLCDKTGDNWCDGDLEFIQDTTNPLGWTRRFSYEADDKTTKEVCLVLPPRPGVSAGYVASEIAGAAVGATELPTDATAELWLGLMRLAACGSTGDGTVRADAFATLATVLIEGDAGFVDRSGITDARYFSAYRNGTSNRWATNIGERILLDLWKDQAAAELRGRGCQAGVSASKSLDTDRTRIAGSLPEGGDCTRGSTGATVPRGTVSDENLWLWGRGVGMPPSPYSPFASFGGLAAAVDYVWKATASL